MQESLKIFQDPENPQTWNTPGPKHPKQAQPEFTFNCSQ